MQTSNRCFERRANPFQLSNLWVSSALPLQSRASGQRPKGDSKMDNRERDKMKGNTSGSDVDRNTSSRIGKDKGDSSADFGKDASKPEKLNEPNSRGSSS